MAVIRMSLTDILTAINEIIGVSASAAAEYASDANLCTRINCYLHELPAKLNLFVADLRKDGFNLPYNRSPRHDMWLTNTTSSSVTSATTIFVTSASQVAYLPNDYDQYREFYNATTNLPICVVSDVDKWHYSTLRNAAQAQTTAIEILGYATETSGWRRKCTLYPPTLGATVPSLTMQYWRIPAAFPNSTPATEYPDLDSKFESICVYGPACDILRKHGTDFAKYEALEKELLKEMAYTARGW